MGPPAKLPPIATTARPKAAAAAPRVDTPERPVTTTSPTCTTSGEETEAEDAAMPAPSSNVGTSAGDGSGGLATAPSPGAPVQPARGREEAETRASPLLGRLRAPKASDIIGCPRCVANLGMKIILNRTMSKDPEMQASVSPVGARGQKDTAGLGCVRPKRRRPMPKTTTSSAPGQEASGSGGPAAVPKAPQEQASGRRVSRSGGLATAPVDPARVVEARVRTAKCDADVA